MTRLRSLSPGASRALMLGAGPALVVVVQLLVFPVPLGIALDGLILGILTALVTVGLVLIYRANRVINFAQADLGYVPAVLATMLILASGLNYFLAFFLGLGAAVVLGVAVEFLVIRRFFASSRLILTVATVGISQLLAFGGLLLPRWWDERIRSQRIDGPFDWSFEVAPRIFDGDHVVVLVVGPLAIVAVGLLVRYTALGIAIRASAERADRAGLLGIPVKRLQTVVWVLATALAYLGVFLTSSVTGLQLGGALGFGLFLRAVAALMFARMVNIPVAVAGSIALAILQQAVNWNADSPTAGTAVIALVIIVTLLVLRPGTSRADRDDTATWQASDDARAIPPELRRVPEIRWARWALIGVGLAIAVWLPHTLDSAQSLKASATLIFALVMLSLVVLTGWAGQVSLGQTAFMAVGAVVGARLTNEWGVDLALALPLAGLAGLLVAVLVGIPALRMPGLYLAVTTLAFATAMSSYLLNRQFARDAPGWLQAASFNWIPGGRVERLPLLGRVDWDTPTRLYYVVLASVLLAFLAVRGVRYSRTGRVLIALRENEQATQSYGVSATRAKLTAFGLSGFIAAYAGTLWVHHQQAFEVQAYSPGLSLGVFTGSVVGGVGSLFGAFLGGLYWTGGYLFLQGNWRLLTTGAGVLVVLLILPSGLAGGLQRLRDYVLRRIADRHGIIVPSLTADVAVAPQLAAADVVDGTDEALVRDDQVIELGAADDVATVVGATNRGAVGERTASSTSASNGRADSQSAGPGTTESSVEASAKTPRADA